MAGVGSSPFKKPVALIRSLIRVWESRITFGKRGCPPGILGSWRLPPFFGADQWSSHGGNFGPEPFGERDSKGGGKKEFNCGGSR